MRTCTLAIVCTIVAASSHAQTAFPSFHTGGFADIELHTSSDNVREGLDLAEFDVYSIANVSDAWSALAEGVAQRSWRENEPGEHNGIELDLERLYVQYARSDDFRLEIGETHTGIIRWNEREHRSRFLQTPIDVPAIARRPQDDGGWPLRFVGIWASGRSSGPLGLAYGAGVGAGSGRSRDEIPIFRGSRSPSFLFSLSTSPDRVPGLELAAAAYAQHLRGTTQEYEERDVTLSANFVRNGTEVRGEWAHMNHRATDTDTMYRTVGYYLLLSKRLNGRFARLRPYVLLDHLDVAEGESYLRDVTPESAFATGLRYDVTSRFSLKGEFRSQRASDGDREFLLGMQIGYSF